MDITILYEDNHLLVVNKPAGVLVQPDKNTEESIELWAKAYIKKKYNKPNEAFIGIPHRLDRPTTGIVIIARTSKALVRLNEMFKNHSIKKTYWAITKNRPQIESQQLIHYLLKNEKKNMSKAYNKEIKYSQQAILNYSVIKQSDNYSLLEIDLKTGRHHQIRAQLSAIQCPIKGDLKYGADRSNPDGSICLHARKIMFEHPTKKENIKITAPAPNDPLWKYFENE